LSQLLSKVTVASRSYIWSLFDTTISKIQHK